MRRRRAKRGFRRTAFVFGSIGLLLAIGLLLLAEALHSEVSFGPQLLLVSFFLGLVSGLALLCATVVQVVLLIRAGDDGSESGGWSWGDGGRDGGGGE
jgi:cation transporter-like permease